MIGGRKRENGLYLEKFETRKEAREYIEHLANRYRYAPNQKRTSIRKLVEEAKRDGVAVNRNSLGSWFRELGVTIRDIRVERGSYKTNQTYSISNEIIEEIEPYPNKSYLVELGLRIVTRMPMEDVVLFFPQEEDEVPINAIFKTTSKGRIRLMVTGKLKATDKAHLQKILDLANENGIGVVKEYAETFNFKYFGGD